MRSFTARRLALAASVLLQFSVISGCSRESEGERCGTESIRVSVDDNSDCADGLSCTPSSELANGASDKANRCCYALTRAPSDSRCKRLGAGASGASGVAGGTPDTVAGAASEAAGSGGQ
jgi:hypothetical protein